MFDRLEKVIGNNKLESIKNTSVMVIGIGGVGGACFEALVRMGIKYISIVDGDSFSLSNLNRQLLCNRNNIGHSKANEAYLRAISINPDINVETYKMFLTEANINDIDFTYVDYIIDCCDTMTTKLLLVKKALEYNIKIISSMGTGNRLDATKLEITNIWKTDNDPVARVMRKLLRDNDIKYKLPVLISREIPIKVDSRTPGSVSFVPNVAGFYIANYVFNDIINYGCDNNG